MALTGSIWHLIGAVLVFLGSHSLTNMKHLRAPAQRLVGKRGFYVGYSIVSVLLLAWMIAAYADAPTVVLWPQAGWMRWVPPLAMLVAAPLGVIGLTSANPFSIGPGGARFDASRPGIVRLTRHPVVWALALWSGAHIVPNGDAAALTMFVPLFALALMGPRILDARRRNALGAGNWQRLADEVASVPLSTALRQIAGWKPLAGLAVYALLLALHQPVIGVSPLP
jgi:uncharacterized membrane protein